MFKVVVANQCGCFKRSSLQNNLTFDSKDDALLKAIEMRNHMNKKFCKKHEFEVQEVHNNFTISFYTPKRDSSCCGTGCCM